MDMGFPRESCVQALNNSSSVEGATEWLLSHSSEEDQLIRAITMSLENSTSATPATADPLRVSEVILLTSCMKESTYFLSLYMILFLNETKSFLNKIFEHGFPKYFK